MGNTRDYDYHIDRARAEMDCAYRAGSHAAAAAHMKLSALHMDCARLARRGDPAGAEAGPRRQAS